MQSLWNAFQAVLPSPLPKALAPIREPADTVVLVTLDGVRPRELLTGADPELTADRRPTAMPFLMQDLLPRGSFIGSDTRRPDFRIGSPVGISMSGYHSIFAGRLTRCTENEDPPPRGTTLATNIQDAFPEDPAPVAAMTTWDLVVDCLKLDPARAVILRGRAEAVSRAPNTADGATDAPIFHAALQQLQEDPPRLLYVGFDETDDAGHRNDYARYLRVLERYDGYLRAFEAEIAKQTAQGRRITLIVATDHGRGFGREWVQHRWNIDGTVRAWLFAMGHGIAARGHIAPRKPRSHYNIRPTIAHLLGLPPSRSPWHSGPLEELVETNPPPRPL
ncbi:hypothetical protein AIOL_001369 [Candidatus Rhodobacter oscarellae]|uniref:Metalloenzyme domain-containing protein n=1 Tax=Candidatus Rhodobacter oscarellae TaxID=1675527 RepID=A0A0J9E111_9RHOB|nr:hypothetical protein AIOL_001369 [Candidatus Rhodobacter lobularis]